MNVNSGFDLQVYNYIQQRSSVLDFGRIYIYISVEENNTIITKEIDNKKLLDEFRE